MTTQPPSPEAVEAACVFVAELRSPGPPSDKWVWATDYLNPHQIQTDRTMVECCARILAAEVERLRAKEDAVCEWKQHDPDAFGWDVWATQCGEDVSYDPPIPKDYPFCPGCGRKVKIQPQTNEEQ